MFKMSLLNVSNLTFDSGSCVSATGCTLDGFQEDIESCLPQVVKNYKVLAIINIVMIIIIGGFGNLFTIVAICVARVRYYFFSIRFIQWWLLILGSVLNPENNNHQESCKYVKMSCFLTLNISFRHKIKFEHLWNSTTILMLNLSLCDLLYCVLGLPVFISIYYNGYLPESDLFCRWENIVIFHPKY